MSDRTLEAIIKAVDQASPTFRTVADGAQKMGVAVETAGTVGATGLKQTEAASSRLRTAFEGMRGAGGSLAVVLSSVGELTGEVSRSAAEAGASEERLKTAVADTGASYEDYARQIEDAIAKGHDLAFSHEAVESALSNLVTITKDTGLALKDLSVAEDVARARGIDLGTAALAIGRAQEGNAAALTRLGFVVDHTATATQQLAAVQQQAAGQAEAFASTSQGAISRMGDSLHMLGVEIGGALGQFQPFLAMLPGLTAGGTLVARAFGELAEVFLKEGTEAEAAAVAEGELAVATEAAGVAAEETAVSVGILDVALGPVGL